MSSMLSIQRCRPTAASFEPTGWSRIQCRSASLLRRPKRPYTFTQLVTLSDGSTYTHRTTSPAPVYRSTKDSRNSQLWNPTSQKLMNLEADEAGRLRAFREKFGRGWDAKSQVEADTEEEVEIEEDDNLMDLISGFRPSDGQSSDKQ